MSSIVAFVVANRYVWTVTYFVIILTEIPILIVVLLTFAFEVERLFTPDIAIVYICVCTAYQFLLFSYVSNVNFVLS